MKQKLEYYGKRFESLKLRERFLILMTVLTGIVVLGYLAIIEPQVARLRIAQQQLAQQKTDLADMQRKTAFATTNINDPDAATRANLAQVQQKAAEVASRLKTIGQTLVAPDRVAGLLEEILKRNRRIELVSLRNLPPADLIERKDKDKPKETSGSDHIDPAIAKAATILKGSGIDVLKQRTEYDIEAIDGVLFKHGVEITVAGSYGDLMNYLADLEKMPQRMLWSSVKLTVEEYPRARMTFVVYTLSLDKAWLVV